VSAPAVSEIDRIADLADPIVRNLQITQCYHELSTAMREITGAANWCTFATWASRQAGQTIRGEDLARAFDGIAGASPEIAAELDLAVELSARLSAGHDVAGVRLALLQALNPQAAFERAADAVARGNKKVFEEIGREFARFLAAVRGDGASDAERIARFLDGLRPGEPPDGQRLLVEAFTAYGQARLEDDPQARAELVLLANLLIGLHEQTRLQPEIAEALDAPAGVAAELRPRLLSLLLPGPWLRIRRAVARFLGRRPPLDEVIDRLVEQVQRHVRRVTTQWLMTLHLSRGEVLRLGQDLRAEFPPALMHVARPELQALLVRIDPTPGSREQSGAQDWADLDDRMHFIADLFRAYHARAGLFDAPFTLEQVAALKAGRRPEGRL
jgi:hypothetical protein